MVELAVAGHSARLVAGRWVAEVDLLVAVGLLEVSAVEVRSFAAADLEPPELAELVPEGQDLLSVGLLIPVGPANWLPVALETVVVASAERLD